MNITKIIAIYARVSTARQEEEQTIQTQISVLNEFAEKNGYTIVESYLDDGWSGDSIIRPSLDKLRNDVKKKKWEAVLIYDPDRLARRYSYQELIMDELRDAGIEVIFITITSPKNSEDKILQGVRGLFAEYERVKIAERFRLGKLRKVKEGHLMLSTPLYGYYYIPKQDQVSGYYEINENEARIVRLIFKWVDEESLTIRGIIKRLHELAIMPRKSKREVWSTSTLSKILKNKAYIGEAHWGSGYAVIPQNPRNKNKYRKIKKSSRKAKPMEEWIMIPVPAILDKELFNRVRFILETNFASCQRNTKNEYLLSGKIWCQCGKRRAGEGPKHGKYLYYRCESRINHFPLPTPCNYGGINAKITDNLVWQKVSDLMSSPELMKEQVSQYMKYKGVTVQASFIDEEIILKEIVKLKNQEDRFSNAYANEILTMDKFKEYIIPLKQQIQSLELQLSTNKQNSENDAIIIPENQEIESFAAEAIQFIKDMGFELKRGIIRYVIDRIVATQEQLKVYGRLPVTNNSYVELCSNHRNGLDKNQQNLRSIPFEFVIQLPPPQYVTVKRQP